jgi:hypothetical protein
LPRQRSAAERAHGRARAPAAGRVIAKNKIALAKSLKIVYYMFIEAQRRVSDRKVRIRAFLFLKKHGAKGTKMFKKVLTNCV